MIALPQERSNFSRFLQGIKMKKYWLIPLMILFGAPYANSCGGQFDPASGTCRIIGPDGKMILYNSAPPQSGYSGGYSSDDYSNAPSQPIPFYAAIAVNRNTGDWGWSTGTLAESSAIEDAKNNCEKAGNGPCDTTATQLNGCLAMASSRGKNGSWSYFLSNSGTCGSVEKEALSNCRASKAKNCKIEIGQLDSEYQYLVEPLLRN